ncbi:MAG: hypothetical protein US40_C0009G0010 [Candidatus Roizmanbacteria bacterium GW2011_GWC2_37_13]|uniref:HD/PDEase domain-containing protein n=1 Tax=Candidatus Roizmanbacteria bacterium GW2011_GWC2_37_13 TaxID=1618486 RepID=A0A0G0IM64_9BACT|nr:MAG: hypothetical protein US38_C0009G0013 [Candidatus Roizmanbacteria bacterium GW2011_GWC1_37_12]KKQ25304.1 MAG: hypothetical protein US40_C0009G0010 [Candidatus Roizmanbacteria bacterium GW2011_GWC2_37_13]
MTETMRGSLFIPTWMSRCFDNKPPVFDDLLPDNNRMNDIRNLKHPKEKVRELLSWLGDHHRDTLYHTYDVALTAYRIAKYYYKGIPAYKSVDLTLKKIFTGGLIHDIGKVGIEKQILDRSAPITGEQKNKLILHGKIGEIILEEVGLNEFIPFATEHHLGNSLINHTSKQDLENRHPLVEFIALADLISASLDHRRKYKRVRSIDEVIKEVRKKTKKGVFSPELERAFLKFLSEGNKLPPYTNPLAFGQDFL